MYKIVVISGPNRGTSYPLQAGEVIVGRQSSSSIALSSSKVSKQHCAIQVQGEDILLRDLGSSNGTFVNGVLTKAKKLKLGDRISIGEFVLEVVLQKDQTSLG